jgi:hypothetical protein
MAVGILGDAVLEYCKQRGVVPGATYKFGLGGEVLAVTENEVVIKAGNGAVRRDNPLRFADNYEQYILEGGK